MSMFAGVCYYLSPSFTLDRQDELQNVLNANGACEVAASDATHIITNTLEFDGAQEARQDACVITDRWVDRCLILGKLQSTQFYSPDPNMIFSGVVACSTGLSKMDNEVLCAGITARGGQWRDGLTREVTHLFAQHPSSDKYETAIHHKDETGIKVLLPHWFDDSFKLDVLLPTESYEWPEPSLFAKDAAEGMEKRRAGRSKMTGSSFDTEDSEDRNITLAGRKLALEGKRVLLSPLLDVSLRSAKVTIEKAGGIVMEVDEENDPDGEHAVDECDVLVAQVRAGVAYVKASQQGKIIGTLIWLFHVSSTGHLSMPQEQLLHYPRPRRPIAGFEDEKITVTNYTGEIRDYLKELIKNMGAEWTPGMSGKNTIVVAAYIHGTKTTKARQWSIPIVNHTWLEDCYVSWRKFTPALPKYIMFPNNLDFSNTIGARGLSIGTVGLSDADIRAALEQEQEWDEADAAAGEVDGAREQHPQTRRLQAQPSAASVMDAHEVESVVTFQQDDDAMEIDGKENERPRSRSPSKRGKKGATAATSVDRSPSSSKKPPSRAKPKSRAAQVQPADDDDDNDDGEDVEVNEEEEEEPAPRRKGQDKGKKKPAPAPIPSTPASKTRKRRQEETEAEASDDPGPSTRSRPVKGNSPIKYGAKAASKPKSKAGSKWVPAVLDAEVSDDDDEAVVSPSRRRVRPAVRQGTEAEEEEEEEAPEGTPSPRKAQHSSETTKPSDKANEPKRAFSVLIERPGESSPSPSPKSKSKNRSNGTDVGPGSSALQRTRSVLAMAGEQSSTPRWRGGAEPTSRGASSPGDHYSAPPSSLQRTPSRRSAAAKASQRLHDVIMPDVVNFQKEMKSGSVKGSWENGSETLKQATLDSRKKRRSSGAWAAPADDDGGDDDGRARKRKKLASEAKSPKKRAKSPETEVVSDNDSGQMGEIKLLTTQEKLTDPQIKALQKLGVKMTEKPSDCTHLIAAKIARTEKFLCAVAVAPKILSIDWAKACITARKLLPEDEFHLVDRDGEKKHNFKLEDALKRAKKRPVFKGKAFYCTPKCTVEYTLLKNVVQAGGGLINRITQAVGPRSMEAENKYIISTPGEKSLWRALAEHGKPIFSTELLLECALRQEFLESDNFRIA